MTKTGRAMMRRRVILVSVVTVSIGSLCVLASIFLPRASDFWKIAAQPIATVVAGFAAILAAALAFMNGHYGRVQEHSHHSTAEKRMYESSLRERYAAIASQLSSDSGTVRRAGFYSLVSLADDWEDFGNKREQRVCISLLVSYMRSPVRDAEVENGEKLPGHMRIECDTRASMLRLVSERLLVADGAGGAWRDCGIDLTGISVPWSKLDGIYIAGEGLKHSNFKRASLNGVKFTDCDFDDSTFGDVEMMGADFTGTCLTSSMSDVYAVGAIFENANMDHAFLCGYFSNARMSGASCRRSTLRHGNFSGADMSGAILVEADLRNADLSGAILVDVDFTDADLSGSDLSAANLSNAVLDGAKLKNVTSSDETVWPVNLLSQESLFDL